MRPSLPFIAPQVADCFQHVVAARERVPDEPAAHDQTGSTHPTPAVNVYGAVRLKGLIDRVESGNHLLGRRNRKIANREPEADSRRVAAGFRNEMLVRLERPSGEILLTLLGQV